MKKTYLKKIPLIIAPIALVATPLFIFSMKANSVNDIEKNNIFNHEIEKLINNNKLSLKDKINQFNEELLKFRKNTIEILANLKEKITDWENLFEAGKYLNKFNLKTKSNNKLPSEFKDFKNKSISLNNLNLSENLNYLNTTFEYKFLDFNDLEGNITVEVELKYKTKFSLKTTKKISGFKIFNENSNNDFKQIEGFFDSLVKKDHYDISNEITIKNRASHLLEKIITKNFNSTNLVSLSSTKNNNLLSGIIDSKNIVAIDVKITDLKNASVKNYPTIKFKVSRNSKYNLDQVLTKWKTYNSSSNRLDVEKSFNNFDNNQKIADILTQKFSNLLDNGHVKIVAISPSLSQDYDYSSRIKLIDKRTNEETESFWLYFKNYKQDSSMNKAFTQFRKNYQQSSALDIQQKFTFVFNQGQIAESLSEMFKNSLLENGKIKFISTNSSKKLENDFHGVFKLINSISKEESGQFNIYFKNFKQSIFSKPFNELKKYNSIANGFDVKQKISTTDTEQKSADVLNEMLKTSLLENGKVKIVAPSPTRKIGFSSKYSVFKLVDTTTNEETGEFNVYFKYFKDSKIFAIFDKLIKYNSIANGFDAQQKFGTTDTEQKSADVLNEILKTSLLENGKVKIVATKPTITIQSVALSRFKLIDTTTKEETGVFNVYFKNLKK